MKQELLYSFTSLFVAMNVFGIFPLFVNLTEDVPREEKLKIVYVSSVVAFFLGLIFIVFGNSVFNFLGITTDDFKVGGGILLFTIALTDLMSKNSSDRKMVSRDIAIVPVATPLVVGPACLTTLIILISKYSYLTVISTFLTNILIALLTLMASDFLAKTIGKGASKAMAKISSLLLLAISVAMIRSGVTSFIISMPSM